MDNLEKFIRNNRNDLDRYDPSPEVWERIKKDTGSPKARLWKWSAAAAVALIIIGTGFIFYSRIQDSRMQVQANSSYQQQIGETEFFYNSMINSLYEEAKPMLTRNPDIEKELKADMEHIDRICSEIKRDLKDNVANQEVVEALIQNYKIKILLLEDMLSKMKESEKEPEKRDSNEL
jgi:CHASE3 domain sensor protein